MPNNNLGGINVGTSGTMYGTNGVAFTGGGGSSSSSGGGTTFNYDPRIGGGALPQGIYGAGNRAYVRNVQDPELSQTQMQNITSQNSPLMRQARMQGARQAGARGMLNSSMASESSQNAVIQNAMPMALQDAQAYQEAAGQNLQYLNQRDIANMQDATQNAGYASQIQSQELANLGQLQRQRENLAYEGEQAELGRRYGFQMEGLQNQFGAERDYRNYGFDVDRMDREYSYDDRRSQRNFMMDQAANNWDRDRDRRDFIFQNTFLQNLDDPEGFDVRINDGIMNYWNQWGDQYMMQSFYNIYGGP